jgi:class 3 adenylate cyclase
MESNFGNYNFLESFNRIDEVILESDNSFEELDRIPSRDKLTFNNGFYVNCSALYVDIRDSSELPTKHNRPKLAKLYRAYISEIVALLNGNANCAEINIIGDGILGIFDTPFQKDINDVFSDAYQISSLVAVLNYKLKKNDIEQIRIGIGASWGRALMIKAGFKGSRINDIIWMGEVVNEASKLSSYGNKTWSDNEIQVSINFYNNLDEYNKTLLQWNANRKCYHGNIGSKPMIEWYEQNCL